MEGVTLFGECQGGCSGWMGGMDKWWGAGWEGQQYARTLRLPIRFLFFFSLKVSRANILLLAEMIDRSIIANGCKNSTRRHTSIMHYDR